MQKKSKKQVKPFLNDKVSLLLHNLLGCAVLDFISQRHLMRHHFIKNGITLFSDASQGKVSSHS